MIRAAAVLFLLLSPCPAYAITATLLTQGSGGPALTVTTASITPISGQLILVWYQNSQGATNAAVTGTNGLNVTWTRVNQLGEMGLYRGVPSSGTAGTLTLFSGTNVLNATFDWLVLTYAGVDQTTNQGIVQSAQLNTGSGSSQTITLAAFAQATNATIMGAAQLASNTTCTPKGGYTGVTQASASSTLCAEFLVSSDTVPSLSYGATAQIKGIAAELDSGHRIRHRVTQ